MIEINRVSEFKNALRKPGKTIACFCASWCPFCRRFNPIFDKYKSHSISNNFIRVFLDEESNPLWEDYALKTVPTIIMFEKGEIINRLDGGLGLGISETRFTEWLRKC